MLIIGCDYHPGFQQIAFVDTETGECGERRLAHREEAEQFYQDLKQRNAIVRLGTSMPSPSSAPHRAGGSVGRSCSLSAPSSPRFLLARFQVDESR